MKVDIGKAFVIIAAIIAIYLFLTIPTYSFATMPYYPDGYFQMRALIMLTGIIVGSIGCMALLSDATIDIKLNWDKGDD